MGLDVAFGDSDADGDLVVRLNDGEDVGDFVPVPLGLLLGTGYVGAVDGDNVGPALGVPALGAVVGFLFGFPGNEYKQHSSDGDHLHPEYSSHTDWS